MQAHWLRAGWHTFPASRSCKRVPSAGRASRWYSTVGCDGPLNASSRLDERRRTVNTPAVGEKRGERAAGASAMGTHGTAVTPVAEVSSSGSRLWFPGLRRGDRRTPVFGTGRCGLQQPVCGALQRTPTSLEERASGSWGEEETAAASARFVTQRRFTPTWGKCDLTQVKRTNLRAKSFFFYYYWTNAYGFNWRTASTVLIEKKPLSPCKMFPHHRER